MFFEPTSYCYFYPTVLFNNGPQVVSAETYGKENHYRNALELNSMNIHQNRENAIKHNIMTLSWSIQHNFLQTNQIIHMLDGLEMKFETIENHYYSINEPNQPTEKEFSVQTCSQESFISERTIPPEMKNNRTHPKIKLMEKIFGKKSYTHKLVFDGKFPKILFKQRNINLKIMLKNMSGESVINANQISLNLKVFQNNGDEIVLDSPQHSFMQGLCQAQIEKGVGKFSKLHPREVSRGFSGKGVCIIIYATSQQNQSVNQGQTILASEIQPLIFYNIKVVVKQNKKIKKNSNSNISEDEDKI